MDKKILTVIVPSYNMEAYLAKGLQSLIVDDKDLLRKLEVIVVNDGSKDHTSEIAHGFAREFPEIFHVIDKNNGHYGSCINAALPEVRGEYVKVLDADDSVDTLGFEKLLRVIEEELCKSDSTVDLFATDYVEVGLDGKIFGRSNFGFTAGITTLDGQNNLASRLTIHSICYRTNNLVKMGYRQSEGIPYSDTEWIIEPMITVRKIRYLPIVVTRYLIGRDGQTVNPMIIAKNFQVYLDITSGLIERYKGNIVRCNEGSKVYYHKQIIGMIRLCYDLWLYGHKGFRMQGDFVRFEKNLAQHNDFYQIAGSFRKGLDVFPFKYVDCFRKYGNGIIWKFRNAFNTFLISLVPFVWFIYRYGLCTAICRAMRRSYVPHGMGLGYLFRYGIHRVGAKFAIPTRKSFAVNRMLQNAESVRIVLTHIWDGGATAFLKTLLPADGEKCVVFIVKPNYHVGILCVRACDGKGEIADFFIESLTAFSGLRGLSCTLIVNELVQWYHYIGDKVVSVEGFKRIVEEIVTLKETLHAKMKYFVHDYFCVCPSFNLIDRHLCYCAKETMCREADVCLADNPYVGLPVENGFDIREWRRVFADIMGRSEEVRTFSKDTAHRIRMCFPDVRPTVVPHKRLMKFLHLPQVSCGYMTIGVIGEILPKKGAGIVMALAKYIMNNKFRAVLKVVGTIDTDGCDDGVEILGSYRREELPDIIERSGINVVLLPSVCPETFCYVSQEVIDMGLPVACFNIGAQREHIVSYSKGAIIPEMTVESVWGTILRLYQRVYDVKG